jgi:hypothetical protein
MENYDDVLGEGFTKLLAAVEKDKARDKTHDYQEKLEWIIARARHYSEKTGIPANQILDSWEKERNYWYMNYYQECNQPEIKVDAVRIFETADDLQDAIEDADFRCPACNGVSKSPYECDSGLFMPGTKQVCNWKSWGLLGTLGKGIFVFVKDQVRGQSIFMPIAWEK